jgi:hypothetical protein
VRARDREHQRPREAERVEPVLAGEHEHGDDERQQRDRDEHQRDTAAQAQLGRDEREPQVGRRDHERGGERVDDPQERREHAPDEHQRRGRARGPSRWRRPPMRRSSSGRPRNASTSTRPVATSAARPALSIGIAPSGTGAGGVAVSRR